VNHAIEVIFQDYHFKLRLKSGLTRHTRKEEEIELNQAVGCKSFFAAA
jgi:hypothetical protein